MVNKTTAYKKRRLLFLQEKIDELEQTCHERLRRIFELEREKTDLLSAIATLEGKNYPIHKVKNLQKETQAPPNRKLSLRILRANMNSPRKD